MSTDGECRVLIFVVAYNAERKIGDVLNRIPIDAMPASTEVLIVDDCSSDDTFRAGLDYLAAGTPLKLTVLRNPVNQGYGGNQKIGYQYAIEHGFDVVALLHGDGQYAPEMLPELIAPVASGEADACFGSRMLERGAALRNGMPLYKYVGNRILTFCQNRLLGLSLSEFHSGYRVYSVPALARLPFAGNTNDFHFDTEIIIQFAMAGMKIVELPIPTYYGDEICHVNGVRYARDVMLATLAGRLHRWGLVYRKPFDLEPFPERYSLKIGYVSSHTLAIERVPRGAAVLDLACGPGYVARELAERSGCEVTALDREPDAETAVPRFFRHDLNGPELPAQLGSYDVILALDIIEHLAAPEAFLAMLRGQLYDERTTVVLTTANIGFFVTRFALLLGQFNYGRAGILDLTHTRLFTLKSFRRLLEQEGYVVDRVEGVPAPFPKALGDTRTARFLLAVNRALIRLSPGLFAYQIYAEARFVPPLARRLRETVAASRREAGAASLDNVGPHERDAQGGDAARDVAGVGHDQDVAVPDEPADRP
jgi:glycosyltransferase involved in cell wall biosynthesis